jgi:hypothetical protein
MMLDVYEFWFLPLVATIAPHTHNFISILANKLAFVTGLHYIPEVLSIRPASLGVDVFTVWAICPLSEF